MPSIVTGGTTMSTEMKDVVRLAETEEGTVATGWVLLMQRWAATWMGSGAERGEWGRVEVWRLGLTGAVPSCTSGQHATYARLSKPANGLEGAVNQFPLETSEVDPKFEARRARSGAAWLHPQHPHIHLGITHARYCTVQAVKLNSSSRDLLEQRRS